MFLDTPSLLATRLTLPPVSPQLRCIIIHVSALTGDTSFSTDTDLSKIKSKNIKLGIRSEFVELHDKHIDKCISVKIDKVDDFGNFQLVSAMHGENAIKAKVKRDFAVPAGEAWMKFPVDRCCVYSNEVLV